MVIFCKCACCHYSNEVEGNWYPIRIITCMDKKCHVNPNQSVGRKIIRYGFMIITRYNNSTKNPLEYHWNIPNQKKKSFFTYTTGIGRCLLLQKLVGKTPILKIGGHHTVYLTFACIGFRINYGLPISSKKRSHFSGCSAIVTFLLGNGTTNLDWTQLAACVVKRLNHLSTVCGLAYTHRKYGSEVYGY